MSSKTNHEEMAAFTPTEKVGQCMELLGRRKIDKSTVWAPEFIDLVTVEYADLNPDIPTVVLRLRPQPHMANTYGFMHGGCVTTFIDNATTWATLGDPRYWEGAMDYSQVIKAAVKEFGVSRNLNSTFLRPVPLDRDLLLTCKVQSNSKRYSHITFELKDAASGKQLAVGSHDKAKPQAGGSSKL